MSSAAPAQSTAGSSHRVVSVAAVAALGGFLFGFDSSVINAAVPGIVAQYGTSPTQTGFVVSIALIGCAVGAWYAGRVANRLGRPRTMQVAAVVFIVSAIGSAFPGGVTGLMLWRFVGGLAIGAASVIAPAYIAEIAPPALRGRLGSLQQLAIVTGIFVALLSGWAIATAAGGASQDWLLGFEAWRWMFLVEVVPAVVYLLAARTIPESPRYLVATGRSDEARAVMASMGQEITDDDLATMQRQLEGESAQKLSDLKGPKFGLLPVVWVAIILSSLQQLVGINVIFYYSSMLWQAVGFAEDDSLKISVISGGINIVATLIAIACIDRFGRRPLLLLGSAGMSVSLVLLAYLFGTAPVIEVAATSTCADPCMQPTLTGASATLALIAANGFVIFFGFSWGPVVWVLLGEMFPNRIRAVALSVAAAAQWMANFLVSTTFPPLAATGLGLAYGIYAFFAVVSLLFVWRVVHETKGRSLESMDAEYSSA
ncbi:sugar porter family MFS transporter [Longivirga aurantiaca]|uniref:Sugar porter family MFS transporter n=1 Tax=Longivirga aurantiaca TaxID=1837743 RepID=A0ABW1T2N4_9ACTN